MWTFLASDSSSWRVHRLLRIRPGRVRRTAWHHDLIPAEHVTMPGLINTYLLLTSSFLVVLAMVAAERESKRGTVAALVGTFALGVGFLINKGIEWSHLFHISTEAFPNGWNLSTNIASSTFYLTTASTGPTSSRARRRTVPDRARLAGRVPRRQPLGGVLRPLLALRRHRLAVPVPAVLHPVR